MNVFCDTSVLVAGTSQTHIHHSSAKAILLRIRSGDDAGYALAHTLAETFSVMSRLPTTPKLKPADVLDILEDDIIPYFTFISLQPAGYIQAIRNLAAKGLGGGRIYDLLHLQAAATLKLDRIYTFNAAEWKVLAPDLASIVSTPS